MINNNANSDSCHHLPVQRRFAWHCYCCLILAALMGLFTVACSKTATVPQRKPTAKAPSTPLIAVEKPQEIVWAWQPKALHLSIAADQRLNHYDQQAHALMLCLYQLSTATAFTELAKDPSGVNTLLQCKAFDSSVIQSERLFVQPNEQRTLDLDRLEKTRYLAVVAGYARATAQRVSPIFTFPSLHYTKGMLFWKKDQYLPGELTVNLVLTEHALQSIDTQ